MMKKHVGVILAVFSLCIICLFPQTSLAKEGALKLSPLPTDFASLKIDSQHITTLPYSGFFERTVTIDGVTRTFKVYLPEGFKIGDPTLFIIPEAKRDTAEFLEQSGWKDIADKNKIMLFIAETKDTWNTLAGETKYLNAMLAETRNRTYAINYAANNYIVGYGNGATVAQQYVMRDPRMWAGLATFGSVDIADQNMTEMGNEPSDLSYVPMKEVPLPVWCVVPSVSGQTEKVISYWKKANHDEDNYDSNQYANYIYLPSAAYKPSQMDHENVAKVQVTVSKDATKDNPKLNQAVWSDFLSKTRRYLGIANGDLRSYVEPEQLGAVRKMMEVDGYTREWYEYVPASVKANPDKPVPLVVAMHGRSGSGQEFVSRSGWIHVAEERNFIVVFPTSGIYINSLKGGVVPTTGWNTANDNSIMLDDAKYLRLLVQNLKANHNIDSGRVYATGQSMGSMMCYNISLYLSDIFIATGSTSGMIVPDVGIKYDDPNINTAYDIPYMVMIGDKDAFISRQSDPLKNEVIKNQLNYWINRYQTVPLDQPRTYQNGPFYHRVYYNKAGVPMVHYVNVNNLIHANLPSECWMIYDDFLSKFHRDSNGKLVYENGSPEDFYKNTSNTINQKLVPKD